MKIMRQFNNNSGAYQRVRDKITYPESLYEYLVLKIDKNASECSALDIGCGNGVSTFRLKPYFERVVGADIGQNLIDLAKGNYPDIEFICQSSESLDVNGNFDLITSATSFYWMDRAKILATLSNQLNPGGVFCAYKYDFPVVYGPLRNFIESELVNRWSEYRDPRIENYDNTLEIMQKSGKFSNCERVIVDNIISLSAIEVAHFFLSTSYVTKYIESSDENDYEKYFIDKVQEIDSGNIKVNFDIHCFVAKK